MEYQLKKKEIVSQVEFNNLLTFSLVQNKLQRNFRSIVEALLLNQDKTDTLNNDLIQQKDQHSNQIQKLNDQIHQLRAQLQNIKSHPKNTSNTQLPYQPQQSKLHSTKNLQPNYFPMQQGLKLKQQLYDLKNLVQRNQNNWQDERKDLMRQINNLKNKIDQVGFQQQELQNLKNDIRNIKLQKPSENGLKSNNTLSCKTLTKRPSVLNLIANKQSEKVIQQPSKKSIKSFSKDESLSNNKDQNKQNSGNNDLMDNQQYKNQQAALNQAVEKQFNSLYLELNTLKISLQELKDRLSDNKKQTLKNNSLLSQLKDDLARQVKTRKYETEDLQKSIKDLKLQLLNVPSPISQSNNSNEEKSSNQSNKGSKTQNKQIDDNFKTQINDKVHRLQAMIQNLITDSEFNRLKNDLTDQIQKLSQKIQSVDENLLNTEKKLQDLIVQNQVNTNQSINDLKNRMTQLQQNAKNQANQNQRKNNILNAKNQELKKSLQNLREDLEFYQSLMAQNNKDNQKERKINQFNQQTNQSDKQKVSSGVDDKALQALKKYLGGKIHDLRTNLLGLIRDLEKKMNNKPNNDQQFVKIWDRLNEMNLFLGKKADDGDCKKTFAYLEKKINRLNTVMFKNEDNTEDARIAKTSWFCLSCDKNLQNYQGKVGKHVVWDTMPLKGVNKSFVNQTEQKKKALPQLKK